MPALWQGSDGVTRVMTDAEALDAAQAWIDQAAAVRGDTDTPLSDQDLKDAADYEALAISLIDQVLASHPPEEDLLERKAADVRYGQTTKITQKQAADATHGSSFLYGAREIVSVLFDQDWVVRGMGPPRHFAERGAAIAEARRRAGHR